jgi:hypothetical protein
LFDNGSGSVGLNKTNPQTAFDISGSVFVTGSLNISAGITGSLFGTASYSLQSLSSSYALTASYAMNGGGTSTADFSPTFLLMGA